MKRLAAAILAILFLSTATLHIYAHVGDADTGCSVCHVQQAGVAAAAVPAVVSTPVLETELPAFAAARAIPARSAAVSARAPPTFPA